MTQPEAMRTAISAGSAQAACGPGAAGDDLGEEMCRVQAEMLDMGEDNYQRLCRVCPDPDRRYRVLRRRFTHQVRTALASSQPPWRQATPSAVLPVARGVELTLDWQGRGSGGDLGSPDSFAPGPSAGAETCWRCDAREAGGDLGLCEPCHAALAAR